MGIRCRLSGAEKFTRLNAANDKNRGLLFGHLVSVVPQTIYSSPPRGVTQSTSIIWWQSHAWSRCLERRWLVGHGISGAEVRTRYIYGGVCKILRQREMNLNFEEVEPGMERWHRRLNEKETLLAEIQRPSKSYLRWEYLSEGLVWGLDAISPEAVLMKYLAHIKNRWEVCIII